LILPALAGCDSSPAAPVPATDVEIRLHVTGGIAGVDFAILVDGSSGSVLGESCTNGCDFQAGETVMEVGHERVAGWADRLLAAGLRELNGTDYGNECCDRFQVELEYADALSEAAVRGTLDLMPEGIQTVVAELSGLVQGTLPVLIDWEADPSRLPSDPVQVDSLTLSGSFLELHVGYGGGCAEHEFDARVYGGWMESFPVQVRMALTHDAHGDMCLAYIYRTLRFDLRPLAREYEAAYPGEVPGERRIVLHIDVPGQAAGENVTYRF
jgi:hypothetical protein